MKYKYISGYHELHRLNNTSIRAKYNRAISDEGLTIALKNGYDTNYPITFSMIHNDSEMRVILMLSATDKAQLDMSFRDFSNLPEIDLE